MATCPKANTRETPGVMVIELALVARPLGTFSVAGDQFVAARPGCTS